MYCKLNGGWRATKLHYKLIQASYNLTLHLKVTESDYNSDKVNNTSKVDRNAKYVYRNSAMPQLTGSGLHGEGDVLDLAAPSGVPRLDP